MTITSGKKNIKAILADVRPRKSHGSVFPVAKIVHTKKTGHGGPAAHTIRSEAENQKRRPAGERKKITRYKIKHKKPHHNYQYKADFQAVHPLMFRRKPKKNIILKFCGGFLMVVGAFSIVLVLILGFFYMSDADLKTALTAQNIINNSSDYGATGVDATKNEPFSLSNIIVSDDSDAIFKDSLMLSALGYDFPKKYLVVLQNSLIPRPTGGAIFAYLSFEMNRGEITGLVAGDILDLDAGLKRKINPPLQIYAYSNIWGLNSANWFLNFDDSFKKIAMFYEDASGIKPDFIIMADVKSLLSGPIKYQEGEMTTITPPRARDAIAGWIRRAASIKQLLSENKNYFFRFIQNKELAIYSNDSLVNKELADRDYSGINWASIFYDKFYSINTSSLDPFPRYHLFKQSFSDEIKIFEGSRINHRVEVGLDFIRNTLSSKKTADIYYLKIYLPANAEIISANGFTSVPLLQKEEYFENDPVASEMEKNLIYDSLHKLEFFEESGHKVIGGYFYVNSAQKKLFVDFTTLGEPGLQAGEYAFKFIKQPAIETALRASFSGGEDLTVDVYENDVINNIFTGNISGEKEINVLIRKKTND